LPPVLAAMENEGIRSIPTPCAGSPTTSRCAWPSWRRAQELAGRPFNLGSPKQIGDVLFGEMG
jgi:DNA polymerase-1